MRSIFTGIVLTIFSLPMLFGQNTIDVNASVNWIGFMNVFNLDGGYEFGSAWAFGDLKSSVDPGANTLILQPNFNTYADNPGDDYWIDPATGEGNKRMEASTFVEPGETFTGQDLTFTGTVESYTLDDAYEVQYFIKALDPNNDFADVLEGAFIFDLPESGIFSTTVTADQLPAGLVIQCGFNVIGRNANPANEAALGNVTIGSGVVSVNDLALDTNISVYPNPVSDMLMIDSESPVQAYQVSTILGQTVLMGQANNTNIDVSSLVAGTYLITLQVEEGQKTMKFLKR